MRLSGNAAVAALNSRWHMSEARNCRLLSMRRLRGSDVGSPKSAVCNHEKLKFASRLRLAGSLYWFFQLFVFPLRVTLLTE